MTDRKRWNKVSHPLYRDPGLRSGPQIQLIHTRNRKSPTICHRCKIYIGPGEKIVRTTSGKESKRRTYHRNHYLEGRGKPVHD